MYQDRNRDRDRGGYNRRPQYDRPQYNRPAPIPEGFALYYIAAPCPDEVNTHIHLFKDYMQQKFLAAGQRKNRLRTLRLFRLLKRRKIYRDS